MTATEKQKVPFDPGFSQFAGNFPPDAYKFLEEIAGLKQNHQKKFAFSNLENQIVPIVRLLVGFYLGCVLWGSYLYWKYKDDVREIENNPVLDLSEEEKNKIGYNQEIDFILGFLEKFEKSAKYYLNRSSRLNPEYIKYFETYKEFVDLNDSFKNLKFTNEIKLPRTVEHFENLTSQQLDELKQKIEEIIASGNIENILNIGFNN